MWAIADRRSCYTHSATELYQPETQVTHIIFKRHQGLDALNQAETCGEVQAFPRTGASLSEKKHKERRVTVSGLRRTFWDHSRDNTPPTLPLRT